jgi:DNA polymerase III delta prime subunit
LEGPPGVGKTAAALALANDRGWGVIEMNASDARNRDAVEAVAGRASLTNAFGPDGIFVSARSGGRTLLLMDEADCLTGRADDAGRATPGAGDFREFLRARYGTVEALARVWELGSAGRPAAFASWTETPSAARGAWTRIPAAQRDLADWRESLVRKDTSDRGGLAAMARLVRETRQPLVLTANDASTLTRYSPVFRSAATRVRFFPVPESDLRTYLRRVVLDEAMRVQGSALDAVIARAQGDVRAALNDLESVAELPPGPLQLAAVGGRDLPADFLEFTGHVLAHPRLYRSTEIRDRLDATPDDLLPWIEENLPRASAGPAERFRAFRRLAAAEQLLARARRDRVYALWSFASELMTGGVSMELGPTAPRSAPPVAFPQFLAQMGRSRAARGTRARVLGKLGRSSHLSRAKGHEVWAPFLARLFADPREGARRPGIELLRVAVVRALDLDSEELALLFGLAPESAAVGQLIERARIAAAPTPVTTGPATPKAESARRRRRPSSSPAGETESASAPVAPDAPGDRPPAARRRGQRSLPES